MAQKKNQPPSGTPKSATVGVRPILKPKTRFNALYDFLPLGDVVFEELCCSLMDADPRLGNAERLGKLPQPQYGVDITATRNDGRGMEVMSCKCYATVSAANIRSFSTDFLKNWDKYWKARKVKAFTLAVACDIRQHHAEVEQQKALFKTKGIKYEAWGQRTLTSRVLQNPEYVKHYLGDWSKGDELATAAPIKNTTGPGGLALLSAADVKQLSFLQDELAKAIAEKLDRCVEEIRRGNRHNAERMLDEIRANPVQWSSLDKGLQARVLRQQALNFLAKQQLEQAEGLLAQADVLSPDDEPRAWAMLAYQQGGPGPALERLGTPVSKDGAFLHASLLLEAQRIDDAKEALRRWASVGDSDSEWHRLQAFVALMSGETNKAFEEIQIAERLAPDWTGVRRSGAVIRYGLALSAAARFIPSAYPNPVHIDLVLQDDASQAMLQNALSTFQALLQKDNSTLEKEALELWSLACYANLRAQTGEAETLCKKFINRNQPQPIAVLWALGRGYQFSLKDAAERLQWRLKHPGATADVFQALIACRLAAGDFKQGQKDLKKYQDRFRKEIGTAFMDSWRVLFALQSGTASPEEVSLDPSASLEVMLRQAEASKDWQPISTYLESAPLRADLLFVVCKAFATERQWSRIDPHIDRLLSEVDGAEAVRLVVYTLYNERQFRRALEILEARRGVFAGGKLPKELLRLAAIVANLDGDLNAALAFAAEVGDRTAASDDRLFYASMLMRSGQIGNALPILRDLTDRHEWTGKQVLNVAATVQSEDPELARKLFAKGVATGFDAESAGAAITLGYKLGLDREAHRLLTQFSAGFRSDGERNVRTTSLNDVLELVRRNHEAGVQLSKTYDRGHAPIHLIAAALNRNLADIWSDVFRPGEHFGPTLYIRSGNRPPEFFSQPLAGDLELVVDITGLLTADFLDLLQFVETSFKHIFLPYGLMQALHALEQSAPHSQPKRIEVFQSVIDALRRGDVILHDREQAAEQGPSAYVVYEVSGDASAPPKMTLGAVAEELVKRGAVSAEIADKAKRELVGFQSSETEIEPSSVRTLLFNGNAVEGLLHAGMLDGARDQWQLLIEPAYKQSIENEIEEFRAKAKLAERLKLLRRRLADGIENGLYKVLPEAAVPNSGTEADQGNLDIYTRPLLEVIADATAPRRLVWVDDRCVTGFTSTPNQSPIVSTFEVLQHLHWAKVLDDAAFYSKLADLRRCNIFFLPVSVSELVYWLRQARIEGGRVIESPELRAARRSFNGLLGREEYLNFQPPGPSFPQIPEIPSLSDALALGHHAIMEIWTELDLPSETRAAWSNWVWDSFHVYAFSYMYARGDEAGLEIWRLALIQLLHIPMAMPRKSRSASARSKQAEYFEWFEKQIPNLEELDRQGLLQPIARKLADIVLTTLWSTEDEEASKYSDDVKKLLAGRFSEDLPAPLQRLVQSYEPFAKAIGFKTTLVIQTAGVQFEADAFWTALSDAYCDGKAELRGLGNEECEVEYRRGNAEPNSFVFSGDCQAAKLVESSEELLDRDVKQRRAFLLRTRDQLDAPSVDVDAEIARIAKLPSASARMQAFEHYRETTVCGRRSKLDELLRPEVPIQRTAFAPASVSSLLHYLGLKPASSLDDFSASARVMLDRYGLLSLLMRWSGLPIPLPEPVHHAFGQLESRQQLEILGQLTEPSSTPLLRLKSLELGLGVANESKELDRWISSALEKLLADWESDAKAFVALLKWSDRMWRSDQGWSELSPGLRLACVWSHAEQIMTAFQGAGMSGDTIELAAEELRTPQLGVVLKFDPSYEADVASSVRMSGPVMLVHGLWQAFRDKRSDLLEASRAKLLGLMMTRRNGLDDLPSIHLFEDRRAGTNALNTYFCETPGVNRPGYLGGSNT